MPTGQQYGTNVPQTTLVSGVNASATAIQVASSASWPATPFTAAFEIGTTLQEPFDVTAVAGPNWTITRSIDGTTAFSHGVGATVTHVDIGRDFREARSHIDASINVHGLTGGAAVVGDTQTQTLTNKTLTSPTINTPNIANPSITGTVAGGASYTSPAITGTVAGGATYTSPTISAGAYSGSSTGTLGTLTSVAASTVTAGGLTGTTTGRFVGIASGVGPPTTGTFALQDLVCDTNNTWWRCITAGSPGTWAPVKGRILLTTSSPSATNTTTLTVPSGTPASLFGKLIVEYIARSSTAAAFTGMSMTLNGTGGTAYSSAYQSFGSGNAVVLSQSPATSSITVADVPAATSGAQLMGSGVIEIMNPNITSGASFKNVLFRTGMGFNTSDTFYINGHGIANVGNITSVAFLLGAGNFTSAAPSVSTFNLYGEI